MKSLSLSARFSRMALLALLPCALSGCLIGTVVGTALDVGVEVVKVPFKVGKGVYDAVSDHSERTPGRDLPQDRPRD